MESPIDLTLSDDEVVLSPVPPRQGRKASGGGGAAGPSRAHEEDDEVCFVGEKAGDPRLVAARRQAAAAVDLTVDEEEEKLPSGPMDDTVRPLTALPACAQPPPRCARSLALRRAPVAAAAALWSVMLGWREAEGLVAGQSTRASRPAVVPPSRLPPPSPARRCDCCGARRSWSANWRRRSWRRGETRHASPPPAWSCFRSGSCSRCAPSASVGSGKRELDGLTRGARPPSTAGGEPAAARAAPAGGV